MLLGELGYVIARDDEGGRSTPCTLRAERSILAR